ncbi:hypothetical protein ABPG72_022859 [Tetrahymena utriculariae]
MYNINHEGAVNRRKCFEEDKIQQKTCKTSFLQTEYNTNSEQLEDLQDPFQDQNLKYEDTSKGCIIYESKEKCQNFSLQKTDQCEENTTNNSQLKISSLPNKTQLNEQNKLLEISTTPKTSSVFLETIQKRQSKYEISQLLISQNLKVQKTIKQNNSSNLEKSQDNYVKYSNIIDQNQNMLIKLPEFQCNTPYKDQNQYKKIITFSYIYKFIREFLLSYQSLISSDILNKLQIISVIVTTLDSILGFHTGIYEFGKIVMDRQKIYFEYTNKRLAYDFLSICSLLSGIIADIQFLCIISLIFRSKSIKDKLEKVIMELALKSKYSSFYDIFKLAFVILFIIHFCGCGFFLTGKLSVSHGSQEQNCIILSNIQNKSTQEQYIFSLYFIMVTMVTIGYGDIYPVNQYEKVYVIVISLVTSFVFGFSLNLIGSILTDIKKKSDDLNQKQFQIHKYLDSRNIDFSSQIRVLKYFEFLNYNEDQNIKEGQRLLQPCSKEIRDDILNEYFGNVLKKCKLLKSIFSKEFLDALSLSMKERTFAPGEMIIQRGEKLSQLFIVAKGEIDYHFNNKNSQKNKIELQYENITVDIRIFFSQQPSDLSLKSRGITLVSYIDHNNFIETLQNFQSDKEKYQQLRDQFIYDQIFLFPCRSCGLYKHVLNDCPQICYKVSKMKFLSKYTENVNQERNQQYVRNLKISDKSQFNTLNFNQIIKQSLKSYRCNLAKIQYQMVLPQLNFDELVNNEDDKIFLQNVPKIDIEQYYKQQDGTQISNYYLYSDATLEYKKIKKFKQQETDLTTSNSENEQSDNVSIFQKMSSQSINHINHANFQIDHSHTVNHINEQINIVQTNSGQHQDQQQHFTSDQLIPSEKKISILSNKFSNTQIPNQEEFLSPNQVTESSQEAPPYSQFGNIKDSHQIIHQESQTNQSQQQRKFNRNKQEKQKTYLSKNHNPSEIKISSRNSLTKSLKDIEILRSVTTEQENKGFQHAALQSLIELIKTSICGDLQKGNQVQTSIQSNNKKYQMQIIMNLLIIELVKLNQQRNLTLEIVPSEIIRFLNAFYLVNVVLILKNIKNIRITTQNKTFQQLLKRIKNYNNKQGQRKTEQTCH